MITEKVVEVIDGVTQKMSDKFDAKMAEYIYKIRVNLLELSTVVYVSYIFYLAFTLMFLSNDKEKVYSRAFISTMGLIIIKMMGQVLWEI